MDRERLHRLLRLGFEKGASDIHFQVGCLPLYRFNGELVELRFKVLEPSDTEAVPLVSPLSAVGVEPSDTVALSLVVAPDVVGDEPSDTVAVPLVSPPDVVGVSAPTVTAPVKGSAAKATLAQASSSSVPAASPPASLMKRLMRRGSPCRIESMRPTWTGWLNAARGPVHRLAGGNQGPRRQASRHGEGRGEAE